MPTWKLIRLSVWKDDAVFLSDLDKQKQKAILSAVPVKELFHKDTYGEHSFEGEFCRFVLCTTDFGPIVKVSERMTTAESNMRPSTMELEWCCFLKNAIVSFDNITYENWGDYAIENEKTRVIVIKRKSGDYA